MHPVKWFDFSPNPFAKGTRAVNEDFKSLGGLHDSARLPGKHHAGADVRNLTGSNYCRDVLSGRLYGYIQLQAYQILV